MELTQSDQQSVVRNDVAIPKVGFGTWELEGSEAESGVRDALEIGYRHIDTARAYDNEREVGTAIGGSGIPREQIFLTTKLWHESIAPSEVREQTEDSLRKLGTDYVDLLLIHWPNPDADVSAALETMATLHDEEKVRNIGVSNFPTGELAQAIEDCPLPIFANQVEMHPYLDQSALLEMTAGREVVLEAYSPLAHGELLGDETLVEIGEAHGKSAAQVGIRWLIEHEQVVALPRSSSHENRADNLDVFDFELSGDERERISALARPDGRQIDPDFAPDWD